MSRNLFFISGILILILSLTFTVPTRAAAEWGVYLDKSYKYEPKFMKILGTDYLPMLPKENFTFRVVFTDFLENGYQYDIYNYTGLMTSNQTTFELQEVPEVGNFTLPVGLPIALPLKIDAIENYLSYFGSFINNTQSSLLTEDLLANITDYTENYTMTTNTTLNEKYLLINSYSFADYVNASILSSLLAGEDTGFPITIPENLTKFTMVITFAYNTTDGLFNYVSLKIRSKSVQYGYEEDFTVDIKFALYVPPPPPPSTTTPTTTKTSALWVLPIISIFSLAVLSYRKRKK